MAHIFQYFAEGMLLVLGAAIAGIFGVYLNYHKEQYREKALLKQFATFIYDDLRRSEILYTEILKYKESQDIHHLKCIDNFFASREIYEKKKDYLTLFADENLRIKIYDYYRDSLTFIDMLKPSIKGIQSLNDDLMGTGDDFTAYQLDEYSDYLANDLENLVGHQLAARNLLEDIKPYV